MRRLSDGEVVVASDGEGRHRPCRVRAGHDGLLLEAIGEVEHDEAPEPPITVAFSLVKADRSEWAAAKLAELGVDRIVPLVCERTVVGHGGDRRRGERLRRIVRESSMQARLTRLPRLLPPTPLAAFLAEEDATTLSPADRGGGSPSLAAPVVLVGPEGGWSAKERERFTSCGARYVGLGDPVLRVETAAVVAGGLLCALRARLVAPGERPVTRPEGDASRDGQTP